MDDDEEEGEEDEVVAEKSGGSRSKSAGGGKPLKRQKRAKGGIEELRALQAYLREKVPVEAVFPSEKLHFNPTGDFKDHTADNTISVDGFLWDEADVDELVDAGKLPRNMCLECGSRSTAPLNFVSHSLSIPELNFIFNTQLAGVGGVSGGVVVDVGSRLGCVVYAAIVLGGAREAVGVELNREMCKVQEVAFQQLGGAGSRARVICGDICDQAALLERARVTVLHNPFQFFTDVASAQMTWRKIASMIAPGSFIVASPPLCEQLEQAEDPLDWRAWVEEIETEYPIADDPDDEHAGEDGRLFTECVLYRVKAKLPYQ